MYRKFLIKRFFNAVIMYAIILIVVSYIFNEQAERVVRQNIDEQIKQEAINISKKANMNADQMKEWKDKRLKELYKRNWLDKPFLFRVFYRAWKAFSFDFGNSMFMRSSSGDRSVWKIIAEALPNTILIFTTDFIITTIIGIVMGLKMARKPGGVLDRTVSFIALANHGLPLWWLGMVIIFFFAYTIKAFPSGGMYSNPRPLGILGFLDLLWHMTLPILTLVIAQIWGSAYYIRQIVLGTMNEDFIMSARARGLSERKILYSHTLRSAAPPIVTMVLLGLFGSLGGAIIFEGIFSWPGMGNLYWIALQQNDLAVVMGNVSINIFLFMIGLVILDVIYGLLDPRIKVGGKA
ncbi:MAG: ABC transporter permease [Spirochaetes bacterium]|nr:ABC transporter permease [Spirochaetota bacterium]